MKVVDFGISKMQKEEGEGGLALTRTGVMLGTPFYMSPEQGARHQGARPPRRPLRGRHHPLRVPRRPPALRRRELPPAAAGHPGGKHPNVRELSPELSPELASIVERAIALDPAKRYASAREMLLALIPHGAVDPGASESPPPPRFADPIDESAKTTPVVIDTAHLEGAAPTSVSPPPRALGHARTGGRARHGPEQRQLRAELGREPAPGRAPPRERLRRGARARAARDERASSPLRGAVERLGAPLGRAGAGAQRPRADGPVRPRRVERGARLERDAAAPPQLAALAISMATPSETGTEPSA
ncbi:MAG: hypothetical protein M5U28_50325 [Sandaracinaceae bacterium]|nr:hypothetical protein [Sandaracinaceae bacterium]